MTKRDKAAWLIIRTGIAFAFIYAAIAGFHDPASWIGWFPRFMREALPGNLLIQIWSAVETVLGLWILSGWKIFLPSLITALSLAGLIYFNLGAMDIIFRDVTILAAAIALTIHSFPARPRLRF